MLRMRVGHSPTTSRTANAGDAPCLSDVFLVCGVTYPFWGLLAPEGSADPWSAWLAVGGCLVLVGGLARRQVLAGSLLQYTAAGCMGLVLLQLVLLALWRDADTFYAVATVASVTTAAALIRNRLAFGLYAAFASVLSLAAFFSGEIDVGSWWVLAVIAALAYFGFRLSRQHAAEGLARKYQEELEFRVDERTRELSETMRELSHANRSLRQEIAERKALEERLLTAQKLEALGRLAGGVAHDYNNLFTALRCQTDFLLNAVPKDSPLRADLDLVDHVTTHAAALTAQLLAFGRGSPVQTSVLDLNRVLTRLTPMLRTVLGEDIELVANASGKLAPIRANANQLEQVIVNLALNARDAMPDGGRLTIETTGVLREDIETGELRDELSEDEYVLLAFSDTGVGMDRATSSRAFDPFFTTKGVNEGIGLGLSVVYGAVQQGGGHIRVLSEPGRGTRFEIHWPTAKHSFEEVANPPLPELAPVGGERILLVEDSPLVRDVARRVLSEQGYTVLEAADGEAALRLAREDEQGFDLAVVDVVMPKMSGFELAEHFGKLGPATKVLFISGYTNHPSVRSRELPPGTALLSKPFAPTDLAAKVREVLGRAASAA